MKNGFTLIELLVVVLIIGVLAAVALPQYELAVRKTRFMTGVSLVRPYMHALDRFKMANGYYTHRVDELDIDCPVAFPNYKTEDATGISICSDNKDQYLLLSKAYVQYGKKNNYVTLEWAFGKDFVYCIARDATAHKVCKMLGGIDNGKGYYPIQI